MPKRNHLYYCSLIFFQVVLQSSAFLNGQTFEGEIYTYSETVKDTSLFAFKIKGNKLRFEELNKRKQVETYLIMDIIKKSMVMVNPGKKNYRELTINTVKNSTDIKDFIITKTGNYKTIHGYTCYQWRVQNKKAGTEIQFWNAPGPFGFYFDFLKMYLPADKTAQYYLRVREIQGMLPFEAVELSLLREFKMRSGVLSIEKKTIPASVFEIPAGYKRVLDN